MTKKWKIEHKPNSEFNGYPWHEPATDPTQYHIVLNCEMTKNVIALLWPSGEVWMADPEDEEGETLLIGGLNEFGNFYGRIGITNYLSQEAIKELIAIIRSGIEEWKKLDLPDFSILRPPIEY